MKLHTLALASLGLMFIAVAPVRADPPTTAAAPAAEAAPAPDAASKPANPADAIVCRRVEVTGSHLGKERVCKTKKAWAEEDEANQDDTDEVMRTRANSSTAGLPH